MPELFNRQPAPAGAGPWVLTLSLVDADRLLAVLSDGHWLCVVAESPWPPVAAALPERITQALGALGDAALHLQLGTALDDGPWERELAAALGNGRCVPRFLTDLPEPLWPPAAWGTPPATPLVAARPDGAARLALVAAARAQQRPLVLVDPAWPATQRLALERVLRGHWRDPLWLSQALLRALVQLGLPPGCCCQYGDGRPQLVDTEQGWRPVTALSIDLVGSTSLLQALGAEDYAERLQAYHARCSQVILQLHGSLDAPQGDDGLMAYFGFPQAVEDAAARALTAAWQLSGGLAELGLQARIGVASGQVAVSAQQAFGPEVHLAARLCAAARPGQVLVAPSTRDRVSAVFMLEAVDEGVTLKDFGGMKAVYRLAGLRPGPARLGPALASASPFVGRSRELDHLRSAWAAARTGRLQWCVVQGEAGLGKSRLLQEFVRELRAQGHHSLAVTGQAQGERSPYAAVVDALRRHWAIDADTDAEQVRRLLAASVSPEGMDASGRADLAGLLVLSRAEGARTAVPDAQPRWSELLLVCLQALIGSGPCCLLVDDAHWLDPSSLELLRRLRSRCAQQPLLVLLGERSAASGRSPGAVTDVPLLLQGLSKDEAQEMAGRLGAALPHPLRQRVIDRAGGVPLYLEESLRMLSRRDAEADAEADGDVPATLEDLLMVRLDELGPDRALAQLISVLGRECSAVHLDALLEQADPFVERARQQGSLDSLLNSGLLQALDGTAPGYRFKHALIRDAAYGSIRKNDRKRLHGLCAQLIEQATPGLWYQRPEHGAHHLEAAGELAPAQRAWQAAAQLAATRHAHEETLDLARRALALQAVLPGTAEGARSEMQLHLLIASALIALNGYGSPEVEAAYLAAEQAGQRLPDAAQPLRIRLGLEACYVMRGDLQGAAALAQAAVAATDWAGDARLALQARWALANVHFHQSDWRAALAGFDDCLAHYQPALHRSSSVQDAAVMCLGYSSWIHFELGQADEALQRIARMLTLAKALQHPFSTGVALGFAASIKRLCGDAQGAWPHAQEAVRICEQGGFQVWLAHAWMVRGQLRSDRGDHAGGDADMDRGYAMWVGGGARISCATYLITRAELLLRRGEAARAAAELSQAWSVSEQIGERHYQAELLRLQALCAWQGGAQHEAEHVLRRALDLACAQGKPGLALRCALSLGALQAAQGQLHQAAARLRGVFSGLSQHGACRDHQWARKALACWDAGRHFEHALSTPWEPL